MTDNEKLPAVLIRVPWDVQRTSPNQRKHWRAWARIKKDAQEAARYGWMLAGRPVFTERVRVSIIVRRARVIDQDNAWAACKPLVDQIFNAKRNAGEGALPDDSQKWLELGSVTLQTGKAWKLRPEVVFVVEVAQ